MLKTKLPDTIRTIEQAKSYLTELHKNGESYHPDESAFEIVWQFEGDPPRHQLLSLDRLMDQIHKIEGFNACDFLNSLIEQEEKKLNQEEEENNKSIKFTISNDTLEHSVINQLEVDFNDSDFNSISELLSQLMHLDPARKCLVNYLSDTAIQNAIEGKTNKRY